MSLQLNRQAVRTVLRLYSEPVVVREPEKEQAYCTICMMPDEEMCLYCPHFFRMLEEST